MVANCRTHPHKSPKDRHAIEASYADLGSTDGRLGFVCIASPCPARFSADATAFSLSAQLLYAMGAVDLFARLGVAQWDADFTWINDDGSTLRPFDEDGADPVWGAGVQYNADHVTTRLEFERFDLGGDFADSVSLGVFYRFN